MVRVVPLVLAVVAVIALGAAAATIDTATDEGVAGEGEGEGFGSPGFSLGTINDTATDGETSVIPDWLVRVLTVALFGLGIVGFAMYVYEEGLTGVAKIAMAAVLLAAIVAGLFVGPLALFVIGAVTESIWAFPVGLVAWIGSTVYFARQRTVYGAVRGGCYTVAGLFVVLPPAVAIAGSGGLAGRVGAFIAFEIFALFFAVPLFAVGKVASHLREKKVASADQSKGPTGRDHA